MGNYIALVIALFSLYAFIVAGMCYVMNGQASAHSSEDMDTGLCFIAAVIVGVILSAAAGVVAWLS